MSSEHVESLLSPEEEKALLEEFEKEQQQQQRENNKNNNNRTSSSSSSSSSSNSSFSDSDSDDDDDGSDSWSDDSSSSETSSNKNSSSSSSSSNSSSTSTPGSRPRFIIECDATSETRNSWTSASAWTLKKEQGNIPLEKVNLWYYCVDEGIWKCQPQVVAVSPTPFSCGAMRASFYLRDVTREVAPEILKEREQQLQLQQQHKNRNSVHNNNYYSDSSSTSCSSSAIQDFTRVVAASSSSNKCSFDIHNQQQQQQQQQAEVNSSAQELYVAKSYRRFLFQKNPTSKEKREEVERIFKDVHMQTICSYWCDKFNEMKPPCPRLSFLPCFVLQRFSRPQQKQNQPSSSQTTTTNSTTTDFSASSPKQQMQQQDSTTTKKNTDCVENNNNNSTNIASSKNCDYFSVEPILASLSKFTKYNNNNGYVKQNDKNNLKTFESILNVSALELSCRDAAQSLLHFSYRFSSRKLMLTDMQGVLAVLTDPQILSISGKCFGKGNLGAKGMYKSIKSHKCSHICRALKLSPFNVEEEKKYLKQEHAKYHNNNKKPKRMKIEGVGTVVSSSVDLNNKYNYSSIDVEENELGEVALPSAIVSAFCDADFDF